MFKKKDEYGRVGADKSADRQIIVWITYKILQTIKQGTVLGDLKNLMINGTETINGCSMTDACRVCHGVSLPNICTKFIRAYNKKLFSKSKKYVLAYFEAVENILSNKNPKKLPDLLNTFAESCKEISESAISNKKALFSTFEIQSTGTSTFKSAMDKLIGKYEELKKKLQLEEDRRKNAQKFEILVQKLLTDLERHYSWSVFDDLTGRLEDLVNCFEKAYLSGAKLTVTHPEYTLKTQNGSYLLKAYPVLHALSDKATTDNIKDEVIDEIRQFMDAAYEKLEGEAQLPEMPTNEDDIDFVRDIGAVMIALLKK